MSAFARFLRPPQASRRAYSSFFSSKPGGGGRYFNSAKLPKAVVANSTPKAEPSSDGSPVDGAQAPGGDVANANSGTKPMINTKADTKAPSQPPLSSSSSTSTSPSPVAKGSQNMSSTPPDVSEHSSSFLHRQQHPVVSAKDFKIHQFFSLHRPLLLLQHPASILESAPTNFSFGRMEAVATDANSTPPWLLDEFPEATADADAAAARQLTRALTMSHAGAAVSWEATLRRLGVDVDKDREASKLELKNVWEGEWQEVVMDSVKRKRKKKMKKHKLKKRRKATRAQRLKIGR